MRKDAGPYFTSRIERVSPLERNFAALLFAFKLFAGAMIMVPIIWQRTLPTENSFSWRDFDLVSFWDHLTFLSQASELNGLCLIAAGVVLIGGLIQLLKHSRRAGWWSISCGVLLLALGIIQIFHISFLKTHVMDQFPPLTKLLF